MSLLQRVSLPDYIHGGVKKRSNITNARVHVNQPVVISLDLKDFFPNVTNRKIYKIFCNRLMCAPDIASYLTKLTTLNGSLPQGSPTSTILSSLAVEPLSKRIEGLAKANHASYSQYIDDITVSGPVHIKNLIPTINSIIKQNGFKVNIAKKDVRYRHQEQVVTGVKVNHGLDAPKSKIRIARKQVEALVSQLRLVKNSSFTELASLKGKIQYITQLNKGAGRSLTKRLNKSFN